MAVLIVKGVNSQVMREILAVEPMYNESEEHTATHRDKALLYEKVKQIGKQLTGEDAIQYARQIVHDYGERYPEAMVCLETGLEDSLRFYFFDGLDYHKTSS